VLFRSGRASSRPIAPRRATRRRAPPRASAVETSPLPLVSRRARGPARRARRPTTLGAAEARSATTSDPNEGSRRAMRARAANVSHISIGEVHPTSNLRAGKRRRELRMHDAIVGPGQNERGLPIVEQLPARRAKHGGHPRTTSVSTVRHSDSRPSLRRWANCSSRVSTESSVYRVGALK
jgi:hypothetical protein